MRKIICIFLLCFCILYGSSDAIKDINKGLDIAANIAILTAKPIEIDAYLTDMEQDLKNKAILDNFIRTWTGGRDNFQNFYMIECQVSFSGNMGYQFSHKDDVKQLRSDFYNVGKVLSIYGITNFDFDLYKGKKTDFWGMGKSDDFERYQNERLWYQIDNVTERCWKICQIINAREESITIVEELNSFINGLVNLENKYRSVCYSVDVLRDGILYDDSQVNLSNEEDPRNLMLILDEYAFNVLEMEVYDTVIKENSNNMQNNLKRPVDKPLSYYEKEVSSFDCPKEYLIRWKGGAFKKAGLVVSEKIVPGMCEVSSGKHRGRK